MQPDISPLAKRLAEENNVEWQSLYGSGSDGRIVERDVLEYLARVMAGEEDLNPTPEPLPTGLEAWPEEVAAASGAGPSNARPSAQTFSSGNVDATRRADDSLLDIDLSFEDEPAAPPSEPLPSARHDDALESAINDDIFLFDDTLDDAPNDSATDFRPGARFTADSSEAPPEEASFDLADIAAETPAAAAPDFSFEDVTEFAAANATNPNAMNLDAMDLDATSRQNSQDEADLQDDLDLLELSSAPDLTASQNLPVNHGVALFDDGTTAEDSAEADVSLFLTDASADDGDEVDDEAERKVGHGAAAVSESPKAAGEPATNPAAPLQLVSYGLLLRRHVNLSQLMQAQVAIGQELKQSGPIGPSSLLLRAAAKALAAAPLNNHSTVGLAVFGEDEVQVAAISSVLTRPFREIAAQAAQPDTETGGADFGVIVADMSELDIDEAVLNAGAPVLTLGRVLQDSSEGAHHSTLSLSGKMTVEQGTKFLAVVADLLDSPIRLVV